MTKLNYDVRNAKPGSDKLYLHLTKVNKSEKLKMVVKSEYGLPHVTSVENGTSLVCTREIQGIYYDQVCIEICVYTIYTYIFSISVYNIYIFSIYIRYIHIYSIYMCVYTYFTFVRTVSTNTEYIDITSLLVYQFLFCGHTDLLFW